MPTFSPEVLGDFVCRLFIAAGATNAEGETVAASLVESNLRGYDSHGVILARWYLSQMKHGELVSGAAFEVLHETPALLACDGHLGFGQIQCRELVSRVCDKAKASGIAGGTMRRCGHVGRLGEWVEQAATAGFGALISVNDNGVIRTVAPPGGMRSCLSTNPIAIGVPTGDEPLVLDISTSAVANGKLKVARALGKPVPLGWIQDAQGNPTTDPHVMLADPPGSLLPFGGDQGYKAFGLSLLFDILIAGLSGGFCPPAAPGTQEWNNVLLVVWDPAKCAGRDHFLAEADKLIAAVRNTPRKSGIDRIQLPGDRSAEIHRRRLESGIPVEGEAWDALVKIASKLNVDPPH